MPRQKVGGSGVGLRVSRVGAPQLLTFAVLPRVLTALPRHANTGARPLFAREEGGDGRAPVTAGVLLAFAAGVATALTYSTLEQFVIPIRGDREFELDRHGITRLLMIVQATGIVCLFPFGVLADRYGVGRVLGPILIAFGMGTVLIALGSFPPVVAACVQIGWRTAVYRVGVDDIFLGPFLTAFSPPPRPVFCRSCARQR